jgi:hypothetical protein
MDEFFSHVVFQNFMNPAIENRLLLKNGSIFSESSLSVIGVNSFIDFYNTIFKDTCLAEESKPHFVCTGCGSLKQIEDLICEPDHIKIFNTQGLCIYLFEDLYLNTGPTIKNYLEGPPTKASTNEYYKKYGSSIRGFESTQENLKTIYSFELDSIKQFIDKNNLNNVTVYCGDYNVQKYLQKQYPTMNLAVRNMYVVSVAKRILDKPISYIHPRTANQITHKFLSANGKYKAVRHLIAAYLLDKNSIMSFDQKKSIYGSLKNQLWFDLSSWHKNNFKIFNKLITNLQKLDNMGSLVIGMNSAIPNPNFEMSFDYAPNSEYDSCFCAVINETKYSHPISTFSEKTLNAIYRHKPFILVAPPYTLEYLKKYGFKTFENFWDEGYDREENHEKRLIKIFKVIDFIDNLPITTLRNLYQSMTPILEHNYRVIKTLTEKWPT